MNIQKNELDGSTPIGSPVHDGRLTRTLANASILVVDDEPGMRNFLQKTLARVCNRVDVTASSEEATKALDQRRYDVIVLDNVMPKQTGVDWLTEQSEIGLFSDAILITAHADLDTAIAAMRAGASDFLLKPFRSNQLINAIAQSLTKTRLRRQNSVLRNEIEAGRDLLRQRDALVGSSAKIEEVRNIIRRAATTEAQVIIQGEVGSGTQIAARMLHNRSSRGESPFAWLHCSTLDELTFQRRLYGAIDRSTETGPTDTASPHDDGILVSASGGTLYLEDVDTLIPPCQTLLTQLLTEERFRPLGAERSVPLDVRIIASSRTPLQEAVAQGRFRQDLFYLLSVIQVDLPPLRERQDDIIELANFFLDSLAARMGLDKPTMSAGVKRRLISYGWPGNVVELRNTMERALIQGTFDQAVTDGSGPTVVETLADVEKRHILEAISSCGGNRAQAARQLGIARKTIDRKCQAWGL
ncbi:MAG: sigma-54 dependent transcriptional regulator [Pseudomonadota bacterium]